MDPVTAFGMAGTILQFIESGTNFARLAWKMRDFGKDDNNDEARDLFRISIDLETVLLKIKGTGKASEDEKGLNQLTMDCERTASQLLGILQKLKLAESGRKRDAIKAAFRMICKEDEIKSLQDRLSSYRNQLNLHLLLSLRNYASKSTKQQEAILKKLGIIYQQTSEVGGVSASILEYVVSNRMTTSVSKSVATVERTENIKTLQQDLMRTSYETHIDEEQLKLPPIQLPQADLRRAQTLFLSSLQYDGMIDRESRIATAHGATLKWVLSDDIHEDHPSQRVRWTNLREWLNSDDRLYWITGKPGSGKSTLMKFLCSPAGDESRSGGHQEGPLYQQFRCYPYLKEWAGTSKLVLASYYFWNSGLELQMAQEGLIRTLLHQILTQHPDILPQVAPKHWESLCLFDRMDSTRTRDLHEMLFRAIEKLSVDCKICLFIDGLDEFDGSHEDLISMVQNLIENYDGVKVCVASRPWNIFEDSFGQKASLRVEDLTYDDVKTFVRSKLYADVEFENLRRRHRSFATQLVENIVAKACGVFLWVDLVVASLLSGMRLGDRMEDFQRRLDELPPDLEELYEKILKSLDSFYLGHAAQYFSLVETAEAPLTILQFCFADEESPDTAIKMRPGSLTDDEVSLRIDAMNRRLNSRCKGFLETDRALQSVQFGLRRPLQVTIQYLHRTVKDFIRTPKAQSFLKSSTNPNFDPSIQLCVAYLMDMKMWYKQGGRVDSSHILDQPDFEDFKSPDVIAQCLSRAAATAQVSGGAVIELLEELKSVMGQADWRKAVLGSTEHSSIPQRFEFRPGFWNRDPNISVQGLTEEPFLSLAVRYGIVPYVKARAEWGCLIKSPSIDHDPEGQWPLLLDALDGEVPEPKIIECLLDLGADPNFRFSKVFSQTPWIVALTKATLLYTVQSKLSPAEYSRAEEKWKETLMLMFSKGADSQKVPPSLLTPISKKILQDLRAATREKTAGKGDDLYNLQNWLRTWKLI